MKLFTALFVVAAAGLALAGCDRRKKDEPPPPPEPQSTATVTPATLRERTGEICGKLPANDPGRTSCEEFLSPAAKATHSA